MHGAENQIKLPRKNVVSIIEAEQVKLTKLIDSTRLKIKRVCKEMLTLQPNLTDMDPPTVKLLLAERDDKRIQE